MKSQRYITTNTRKWKYFVFLKSECRLSWKWKNLKSLHIYLVQIVEFASPSQFALKKWTFDKHILNQSVLGSYWTCDNWEWCRKNRDHGPQRIHCREGCLCKNQIQRNILWRFVCCTFGYGQHMWNREGQTCMSPPGPRSPAN